MAPSAYDYVKTRLTRLSSRPKLVSHSSSTTPKCDILVMSTPPPKKVVEIVTSELLPLEETKTNPTGIVNFRDVASIVNNTLNTQWIASNKLYRSARPDEATLADRQLLQKTFKIRTIIDLRTTTEHKQQAEKHALRVKSASNSAKSSSYSLPTSSLPTSSSGDDEEESVRPLRIKGMDYVDINFNGSAYSRFMLSQLDWYSFFRLLYLMAVGRRLEAISIIGANVMVPRGLSGLAIDSLEVCHAEVKAVFEILADESRYPVLVHCTQGKDRTGIVVQLVLMLLVTPVAAVQADYMRTSTELLVEREAKLLEIHSIGLTDEFADCDERLVGLVAEHVKGKYGGVEQYLEHCGVNLKMQQAVKRIMAGEEWRQE